MIQGISTDELKEKISQGTAITIVDVREPEEVAAGMIQAALHIPLGDIPARYNELPLDQDIILVCRSGMRSLKAGEFLQSKGYTRLFNMDGGMLEW